MYIYIYKGSSSSENQGYMRTVRTNLSNKNVLLFKKKCYFCTKKYYFCF